MNNPKLKILLGLTGSVATVLFKKLIKALQEVYDVEVVMTQPSCSFIEGGPGASPQIVASECGIKVYSDYNEWIFGPYGTHPTWHKGDKVLHIEMREQYSAFVIAPCSANTLAKIANGLCDNLLTSVARAWNRYKPMIIAPAMNTEMWEHQITNEHLARFRSFSDNNSIVYPQAKMLACGTEGNGALAEIQTIVESVQRSLRWSSPFSKHVDIVIPVKPHPGSFASERNGHFHTGVDLYTEDGTPVYAMEDGVVVNIEPFTGPQDQSPWWLDTDCILIKGASGVINYGEVTPVAWTNKNHQLKIGCRVSRGEHIGNVKRVILQGKEHPEITGWKPNMLHVELYPNETTKASNGFEEDLLRDPTPYLIEAMPFATKVNWP